MRPIFRPDGLFPWFVDIAVREGVRANGRDAYNPQESLAVSTGRYVVGRGESLMATCTLHELGLLPKRNVPVHRHSNCSGCRSSTATHAHKHVRLHHRWSICRSVPDFPTSPVVAQLQRQPGGGLTVAGGAYVSPKPPTTLCPTSTSCCTQQNISRVMVTGHRQ